MSRHNIKSLLNGVTGGSEIRAVTLACSEGLLNRIPQCIARTRHSTLAGVSLCAQPPVMRGSFSFHSFFSIFFSHSICYLCYTFSSSLLFVSQIRGHTTGAPPPSPLGCMPSFLSREEFMQHFLPSTTRVELCVVHTRY